MADWQINSLIEALHNIAKAFGSLAFIAGGFWLFGPILWSFKEK